MRGITPPSAGLQSPQVLRAAHDSLARALGETCQAMELCGDVRRGEPAREIVSLIVPAIASSRETVAERISGLGPCLSGRPQEPIVLKWQGQLCQLYFADLDNWGLRFAELTGPAGYWSMLAHRLCAAATLRLHDGRACWIERRGDRCELHAIACPSERDFFRLCRTPYVAPHLRFETGKRPWRKGMGPEWYPDFVPYAPSHPPLFRKRRAVLGTQPSRRVEPDGSGRPDGIFPQPQTER